MIGEKDIHWTGDEELLSKYVLGRISEADARKLTSHLEACELCRQVVREETLLVAGIKSAGRRAMKDRLAMHFEATGAHKVRIPWGRVVSLAAMVVILLAVGVYNNWFNLNFHIKSAAPDQIVQGESQPRIESAGREKKESSPQIADTRKPDQPANSTVQDRLDRSNDKDHELGRQITKNDETINYQLMAKSAEESQSNERVGITDQALRLQDGGETAGQVIVSPSQTFWAEGHVTPNEAIVGQDLNEADPAQGEVRAFARPQAKSKTMKDSKISSVPIRHGTPIDVSLSQKLSSFLPQTLQNKQNAYGAIQTLIENRNNDVRMTLYLDSLLPDSELQTANVESFNGDSLVLNLPAQRIGYKLPQALNGQVNTKARQVK